MTKPEAATGSEVPPPFEMVLERFLDRQQLTPGTRTAYRRDLRRYLAGLHCWGVTDLQSITEELLRRTLGKLVDAGFSPATIARNLSSIRGFHRFLLLEGVCRSDPTEVLEAPGVERRSPEVLSVEEAERLLDGARGDSPLELRNRAILELLYAAGLRVSELIALERSWLQLDEALVRVRAGGRPRAVPLGRQAVLALGRYLERGRPGLVTRTDCPAFFVNSAGRPLSRMGVWKILRAAADAAGITRRVSPAVLRHSFASHLLDGGAPLQDVQLLLGHARITTTRVYARRSDHRLLEVHRSYHPRP